MIRSYLAFGVRVVGALLLLLCLLPHAVHAQGRGWADDWVELGCQAVSFNVDHDAVRVGRREGRFKAIRLFARGGDVEMLDLRVIYGHGAPDDIPVRRVLRRGDRTAPLDLLGWERSIDRVEMVYRALPSFRGREALICIEGLAGGSPVAAPPAREVRSAPPAYPSRPEREPAPRRGGRDWEPLGCKQVSLFGADRDSVSIGRREGRFRAIRLAVRGADVEMLDLRVIYADGAPDDIPIRRFLREGEQTRPLDLRGWERAIQRVDLFYRADRRSRGAATVCVEGLQ